MKWEHERANLRPAVPNPHDSAQAGGETSRSSETIWGASITPVHVHAGPEAERPVTGARIGEKRERGKVIVPVYPRRGGIALGSVLY